jgi:hypothetical protein
MVSIPAYPLAIMPWYETISGDVYKCALLQLRHVEIYGIARALITGINAGTVYLIAKYWEINTGTVYLICSIPNSVIKAIK